ncbi:nucleoporin complex subunit 54-domain-containing protein [Gymnopilus junonius]|uniref:Nucleoporin complex subunit 54-domain-containing protein n=1 Tax=Gymnopilus junonius TaxID=109634 RepID=A0A9P5TSM0_GYMJU|nr:nucleoporin complex subunit 54-domain-containing protein [Gymnopilus junonius]
MSFFGNAGTSGGGLFGSTNPQQQQQQQQQPGTSNAFGSTNPNPNPTPNPLTAQPTQIFGTPSTTANANPGGLFGSTNTNTQNQTGGGLFGSTTGTNANQQSAFGTQPQQQQPSTGLFGSTANNPLFGNTGTSNTTTGTTSTSLFGNPSTNPSQATGGGLFGQQQNQPGTTTGTTGTGGGLFGSTTTTSTGSGLFGSNTQLPTQPTGTGIFGSTQTGGGLFGGGAKPATGGGLFGSITTPATSTTTNPLFGGSLFGQPQQAQQQQQQQQQQQPQQQQGGLFGSTAGNPLFGGNKSTLGTSSLGVPLQQTTGFGASTTPGNLLGSRSTAGTQQQPADAQAQFQQLTQSMEKIYNSWNPQSPECQFQYYFYNLVDPKQVSLYGRPLNATNEALWEKAVRENPDPSCLVPVLAVGFDDLRARIDAQAAQSASHIQKLNEAKSRLAALRTQHDVSNSSRLLRAASVQTQVTQRLMRLIQHLHLLIPAVRSSALTPEEEALRGKLEELEEELKRTRRAGGAGGDWAVVDEEGLAQIVQILSEQQNGLQHLTRILQKGKMDLNCEALWDSTSTLRASALR